MMKRRIFLWMGLMVLFFLVGFYQEGYAYELYKVKRGDTLQKISKNFGVSQKEIKDINKLKRSFLRIHQTLLIPSPKKDKSKLASNANKISSSLDGETEKSSIQPNDKFVSTETSGIAANSDSTSAVNIAQSDIHGNEANKTSKVQEPKVKSISKSDKKISSRETPAPLRSYVVKKGDSIYKISRRFHLSVASLKKINHLRSNVLKIGQALVVSNSPVKTVPEGIASASILDSEEEEEADDGSSNLLEGKDNKADMERGFQTTAETIGTWSSPAERNLLVKVLMGFLGTPYKFGGSSIRGLDCSAFVRKIYSFFDINLPRTAREQSLVGKRISRSDLEIGDLVFFNTRRPIGHVGIYVGKNEFVHASYRGKEVRIDTLDTPYYDKRFIKAVRLKKLNE